MNKEQRKTQKTQYAGIMLTYGQANLLHQVFERTIHRNSESMTVDTTPDAGTGYRRPTITTLLYKDLIEALETELHVFYVTLTAEGEEVGEAVWKSGDHA